MSAMDEPQVAWKAIEENAEVFSAEGESVGKVTRVVGDPTADVFTGLALSVSTFGGERYVEAERVTAIWPTRVDLDLPAAEIENLPKHEETPSLRWRPDAGLAGFFRRLLRR